jgi:hypothetical protein
VFKRFPEAKELFKRVKIDDENSGEWRSHLVRVASGLDTIINLLEDPDVLSQQLQHLNGQHKDRTGVKKAYFEVSFDQPIKLTQFGFVKLTSNPYAILI